MAEGGGSWFLVGNEWCEFYHETNGLIYPIKQRNLSTIVGCSTSAVDAALRANASFFNYEMKSADGKDPASPYTFYIGRYKYGLNPNLSDGIPAQISNWNHGPDYGEGGLYSACALHICMHAAGLRPTKEDTLRMLESISGSRVLFAENNWEKKKIEAELNRDSRARGLGDYSFIQPVTAPAAENAVSRGTHYNENAINTYNENGKRIKAAIKAGEIEFPVQTEHGTYRIPKIVEDILKSRGINPYDMPFESLSKIGICYGYNKELGKKGFKLVTSRGEEFKYPVRGIAILQDTAKDDDGHTFFSIQFRNANTDYSLITRAQEKEKGAHRFTNGGPASPVGAEDSVKGNTSVPIILFEGAFDSAAAASVARGKFNAVATQGAKNHRYILELSETFKKQKRVIILAYDDDEAGMKSNEDLKKAFDKAGVMSFRWCGCLGAKDFNELLQKNREGAVSLAAVLAKTAELAGEGYWTKETANAFVRDSLHSTFQFSDAEAGPENYAEFIMREIRTGCRNGLKIEDIEEEMQVLGKNGRRRVVTSLEDKPKTAEDVIILNEMIMDRAAEDGDLIVNASRNGDFRKAYEEKGISLDGLPAGIKSRLALASGRGIYPVSSRTFERSERPVFGLVVKYDDMGQGASYRFSTMTRIPGEENRIAFTHEGGREYVLGSQGIFGFDNALKSSRTPLVITENVFDALRIMSVSEGMVNAVSVDAAIRELPPSYIDRIVQAEIPVIFANRMNNESIGHFNDLGKRFAERNCRLLYWPAVPGHDGIAGISESDMKEGGRKLNGLTASISKLCMMAETGRFTPENTSAFVKAITNGRDAPVYRSGASQYSYASGIFKKMEEEMSHRGIQEVFDRSCRFFDRALGIGNGQSQAGRNIATQSVSIT